MYCVAKVFYTAFIPTTAERGFPNCFTVVSFPPSVKLLASTFHCGRSPWLEGETARGVPCVQRYASPSADKKFRKNSSSDSPRKLRSRCEELFFFLRGTHSARNSSRNNVSKTCSKDTHPDPPSGLSYAPPEKKTNNENIKSPGWVPLQAVAKPPRGLYKLPAPRTQQGIGTSSTSPIALSST